MEYAYCEDTVSMWMEDIAEKDIQEEIIETQDDIKNEQLWVKGCTTKEEIGMHMQNIADMTEYLSRLKHLAQSI